MEFALTTVATATSTSTTTRERHRERRRRWRAAEEDRAKTKTTIIEETGGRRRAPQGVHAAGALVRQAGL